MLKRKQQVASLFYFRADNRYLNCLSLNDDSFVGFSLFKTLRLNTKNEWERNFLFVLSILIMTYLVIISQDKYISCLYNNCLYITNGFLCLSKGVQRAL